MMTKDEVLKLALEALEEIALAGMAGTGQESDEAIKDWHARQAWKFIGIAARQLSAIKEALAQPAQELVADDKVMQLVNNCTHRDVDGNWYVDGVQLVHETCFLLDALQRKSTAPQQREWVGLTKEQVEYFQGATTGCVFPETTRKIEAVCKENNNG